MGPSTTKWSDVVAKPALRRRRSPVVFRAVRDGRAEAQDQAADRRRMVSRMKVNRPKPLDLPKSSKDQRAADAAAPDAPEDLDLRQADFGAHETLGAVAPIDERLVETQDAAADLPPLDLIEATRESAAGAAPRAWPFYAAAAALSALWSLAPIMFALGYRREVVPFDNDTFAIAVFAMLAIGPAVLVWVAAFLLHQGARLAAEARRGRGLAEAMMLPAAMAARGAGSAVQLVRREIEQATSAADQARTELLALRDILSAESARLIETAQTSSRTALTLTEGLSSQREQMSQLAGVLDAQAGSIAEAITRHARMVAEASDLAQTQIHEAEAALAARAADLAAAAGEASDAARHASEDLDRQVNRLETASLGVGEQVRAVEEGLTEQRAALVTTAHAMRADHETFAVEIETQKARLTEVLTHARAGASELGDVAGRSAEALSQLIAQAGGELNEVTQSAAEQRDLFTAAAAQSLGALSEIAGHEREAIERQTREAIEAMAAESDASRKAVQDQTALESGAMERRAREAVESLAASANAARAAAEAHAESLRHRIDQLGETAFIAGQKADTAFDARLKEARALIEQTAELVREAGERSTAKLSAGVDDARKTLDQLEALLVDIDARATQLPREAEAHADTVRKSIERGMGDLMDSARKAAEETQNIDAAFQERVRRNYDMLSEAVRLMGVVAGAAGGGGVGPRLAPASLSATRAAPAKPEAAAPGPAPALDPPLRPRLKLTPTATDEEFKTVFEAAGGREGADPIDESWTWKELLSSMDDGKVEPDALAERLIGEVEAMGIDPGALLPRPRIEQIAAAMLGGDPSAGRMAARQLAPAAVRRLSRRMLTDRTLRTQAEAYVRRYQGLIADAATRPDEPMVLGALLGSDQGRAFLLFDVALGDVG